MSAVGPLVSAISGLFFGAAWWLFFDAYYIVDAVSKLLDWYHFLPLLSSSIGLLVVFASPRSAITEESANTFYGGGGSSSVKRIILFTGLMFLFAGVGLALTFTLLQYEPTRVSIKVLDMAMNGNAPLIMMPVSTFIALVSVFAFKFGRPLNKEGSGW